MILTTLALLAAQPLDRPVAAWIICNYIAHPACSTIRDDGPTDSISARGWRALHRPFPGWYREGRAYLFAGQCPRRADGSMKSERGCYAAFLASLLADSEPPPSFVKDVCAEQPEEMASGRACYMAYLRSLRRPQ